MLAAVFVPLTSSVIVPPFALLKSDVPELITPVEPSESVLPLVLATSVVADPPTTVITEPEEIAELKEIESNKLPESIQPPLPIEEPEDNVRPVEKLLEVFRVSGSVTHSEPLVPVRTNPVLVVVLDSVSVPPMVRGSVNTNVLLVPLTSVVVAVVPTSEPAFDSVSVPPLSEVVPL
jgi:hypothetical protein